MSLQDDVKYIKEELSSDEKILESAFKLERIYKRHKIKIWGFLAVVVISVGGNMIYGAYSEHKLNVANEALLQLQQNPKNSEALSTLKSNNTPLYRLYQYSQAVDNQDAKSLKELSDAKDAMIKDLSKYHIAVINNKAEDSKYYKDLSRLERAYLAIKEGKKDIAKRELAMIAENSPLNQVAKYLKHYTIK